MPLPENFSEWEHLQSVLRTYHNKSVRLDFSDADDLDVSIPRGALKHACLLKDDDTVDMTILRLWLFFFHARKASDLQAPLFGIPVPSYEQVVKYKPQVTLYFKQDDGSIPSGASPVRAEISFRLINETGATLTESELNILANRIKLEFGTAGGYRWRKGHVMVTYIAPQDGLHLQLYAFNEAEAVEVIRKVCDAALQPYNNDYLAIHESRRSFPSNPGNQIILGRSRRKPVERPIAYVSFQRASVSIHGLPNPIHLVGKPWMNPAPLEVFS